MVTRLLTITVAALALAGTAQSAIHVTNAREFHAAIDRIGNRTGAIVLHRARYGVLEIGPRTRHARWLTITARRGARRVG